MRDAYPDAPEHSDRLVLAEGIRDLPRWLFSKYDADQDRKVPRAPWNHPEYPERFVSHKNPEHWLNGDELLEMLSMYPPHMGFEPAFSIPNYNEDGEYLSGPAAKRHVLVDHDDVIVDGKWHPFSRGLCERFDTYTQVSNSGGGVHNIAAGRLPNTHPDDDPEYEGDVLYRTSLTIDISNDDFPEAEVTIYDNARYIHYTGKAVTDYPTAVTDAQPLLDELVENYGEPLHVIKDDTDDRPEVDEEALDREESSSMRVVSEAMARVTADHISLDSTLTDEREVNGQDVEDYDPSWANSKSGTRLGKLGSDHFIYRDGNVKLDTLQVVALEEGIIHTPGQSIEGQNWKRLADALYRRGAPVPRYTGDNQ